MAGANAAAARSLPAFGVVLGETDPIRRLGKDIPETAWNLVG